MPGNLRTPFFQRAKNGLDLISCFGAAAWMETLEFFFGKQIHFRITPLIQLANFVKATKAAQVNARQ